MEIKQDDEEITIFINPSPDATSYDAKVRFPLSVLPEGQRITKEFRVREMDDINPSGALLIVDLQLATNHVTK